LKIDVGFEQSQAYLAQRGIDVRFVDRAVSTQLFEDVLEFVSELGEHNAKRAVQLTKGDFLIADRG
jgi:hypothetical protein